MQRKVKRNTSIHKIEDAKIPDLLSFALKRVHFIYYSKIINIKLKQIYNVMEMVI